MTDKIEGWAVNIATVILVIIALLVWIHYAWPTESITNTTPNAKTPCEINRATGDWFCEGSDEGFEFDSSEVEFQFQGGERTIKAGYGAILKVEKVNDFCFGIPAELECADIRIELDGHNKPYLFSYEEFEKMVVLYGRPSEL